MFIQFEFKLSTSVSQFVGVPLILGFQLTIARRPIWQLWAFDASRFHLRKPYVILAAVLLTLSGVLVAFVSNRVLPGTAPRLEVFALVALGVWPAAYALQEQDRAQLRRALPWVIAVLSFWVIWRASWTVASVLKPPHFTWSRLEDMLAMWLCEFIGCFIVDEVAFRGALDPYLRGSEAGRVHPWLSALFIAIFWALWHLPSYNWGGSATTFLGLFATALRPFYFGTTIVGFLLAFTARRSRTLVLSAALHALGNAYFLSTQT